MESLVLQNVNIKIFNFFACFFEAGSIYVELAVLELTGIHLPQLSTLERTKLKPF